MFSFLTLSFIIFAFNSHIYVIWWDSRHNHRFIDRYLWWNYHDYTYTRASWMLPSVWRIVYLFLLMRSLSVFFFCITCIQFVVCIFDIFNFPWIVWFHFIWHTMVCAIFFRHFFFSGAMKWGRVTTHTRERKKKHSDKNWKYWNEQKNREMRWREMHEVRVMFIGHKKFDSHQYIHLKRVKTTPWMKWRERKKGVFFLYDCHSFPYGSFYFIGLVRV